MHQWELDWIRGLHMFRTPFLDAFFRQLNYFDTLEFCLILILFLWFGRSWKTGLKITAILTLSSLVNASLKYYFQSPRPFHIDPSLGLVYVKGLGFPSGAAQTVTILAAILFMHWNHRVKWVVGGLYFVLISLSRVYLGLHFPSDMVAGWAVGGIIFLIYWLLFPRVERFFENTLPLMSLLIVQFVAICLLFFKAFPLIVPLSANLMGFSLGIFLSYTFQWFLPDTVNKGVYLIRILVGLCGGFGWYFISKQLGLGEFITSFCFSLWLSLGGHWACHLLEGYLFPKLKGISR